MRYINKRVQETLSTRSSAVNRKDPVKQGSAPQELPGPSALRPGAIVNDPRKRIANILNRTPALFALADAHVDFSHRPRGFVVT